MTAGERSRLPNWSPFQWGGMAGAVSAAALCLAIAVMLAPYRAPEFNVEVLSNGLDVSQAGVVQVSVHDEAGTVLQQLCNGPCDDLRFREKSTHETVYWVKALDARGACLACDEGQYVSTGLGSWLNRWRISGAPLRVTLSSITAEPDGKLSERLHRVTPQGEAKRPK